MNELYKFFLFALTGISIGVLFDIFRILRRSFKTIDFITYIQDFLFWILTGVMLLYSIFSFNNGELRAYIFIGIIIGLILYMLIISKYFIKISVTIINILKKIIYTPIKLILDIIIKFIVNPLFEIGRKISNSTKDFFTKIYTKYKIILKSKKNNKFSNKIE